MWHTQAASVAGKGHHTLQMPCQDQTYMLNDHGVTAIALADGAGSALFSHEGATIAVEQACQVLCSQFDTLSTSASPLVMRQAILEPVLYHIRRRAQEQNVPVQELACTLLAVAVREDQYLLFHIGDGVIGYQKQGELKVASIPNNGEFTNTTTFVTSRNALLKARVMRGQSHELEGFVLMSDGCEPALYDKRNNRLAPFIKKLFQRAELFAPDISIDQMVAALSNPIADRTQDDCSLALLTRKTDHFGHWDKLPPKERAAILGIRTDNCNRRRRQINRYAALYQVDISCPF